MQSSYAAQYRQLYTEHWWWRAREFMLLDILESLYPTRRDLKILDVGCGDGLFFPALKRFGTLCGVEPVVELITERGRSEGDIHAGCFDESFRTEALFDLILMLDVIEHIEDETPILLKARECLHQDGHLLITVPAFECLWTHHDRLNHHFRRYTKDQLSQVLSRCGFRITRIQYAFVWPAIIKLLLHYVEKVTVPKNERTHIPPKLINSTLSRLCRAEYAVTKALPVPFGSSIVAVAARQ